VTNWGNGVQISGVHVDKKANIAKVKPFNRTIEIIGDSYVSYS